MRKIIAPLPHKPRWSPHIVFSWFGILLSPAIYFYLIYSYSLNLPFADDFVTLSEFISIFQSADLNDKLSIFLAPQGGQHRVVFGRLVYSLCYVLFGEVDFRVLIFFGNTALVALLYLFFRILKVPHVNPLCFIPVSILLFQLQSWKNMTWAATAVHHQYALLFSGLTFYFLSKNSNRYFYSAFFFSVVSVFTHGAGLPTIFLGWVNLLISKRYRQSLIWIFGTFCFGFFYFKNFFPGTSDLSRAPSLAELKVGVTYFFAFLGSTFSSHNLHVAVAVGAILSFYLCFLTWEKYFTRNSTAYMFMAYIFFQCLPGRNQPIWLGN